MSITLLGARAADAGPSPPQFVPVDENRTRTLITIFSNLATAYPKGLYFSGAGYTVAGPANKPEYEEAVAFTPAANHTLTEIEVPISILAGTSNTLVLTLNADNAGVPGRF
jgi:hypothetical protein